MDRRVPFLVTNPAGAQFRLLLTPETAARDYPDAVEVKPGLVETKARPRARKKSTSTATK